MTQPRYRLPSEEQAERDYEVIPRDSHELIEVLDQMYPPRCVSPDETPEDAHRYAGARAIVDELLYLREEARAREAQIEAEKAEK